MAALRALSVETISVEPSRELARAVGLPPGRVLPASLVGGLIGLALGEIVSNAARATPEECAKARAVGAALGGLLGAGVAEASK